MKTQAMHLQELFARPRSGLFVYQKEGESKSMHDSLYWSPLMDNSDPCQDLIDCSINTPKEKMKNKSSNPVPTWSCYRDMA